MPRSLRYLLVWLSCTVVTVAVVSLTVRFVVHSTAPVPPTAHAQPTTFDAPSPRATVSPTPRPSPRRPTPAATSSPPHPRHSPAPTHSAAPPPSTAPADDCQGGAGTHSVQSQGGQATINWGADAVCLVSAVPAQGFTTQTTQSASDTLVITFSGSHHRSRITATLTPEPNAVTDETSW